MTASYNVSQRENALFIKSIRLLLIWGLITILWGAYVRISGSGDGCGEHWPLCRGRIVPELFTGGMLEVWIEYIHRAKSGMFGLLSLGIFLWSFRLFPKGSGVRKASTFLIIFTAIEALLGAGLVLLRLVDTNQSYLRLIVMSIHLVNTFALMGSIVAVEASALTGKVVYKKNRYLFFSGILILLLAMTGAWASLSSTLSPSTSISVGLAQDFSPNTPYLLKLRIVHPIFAVIAGFLLIYLTQLSKLKTDLFNILVMAQMLLGICTLLSLSPVWLKLTHLLFAELTWIAYQRIFWGLDR